ncbi:MAG: outer membrane beta-barrel family protein [Bacteroidota bacterium]
MIKKTIFLILICFLIQPVYAQYKVTGQVDSDNDMPLVYHVTLWSDSDGLLITGGVFDQPTFQLEWNEPVAGIIRISHVGFDDYFSEFDFSVEKTISLGKVLLVSSSLDEVTVEASRKLYSSDGSKMIMNVSSTYLKDMGTAIDVLKHAPGVITDHAGNIMVFGKGTPLIIVDGRELRSLDELNAILSSDILSITVDRNPSADYSADITSVIFIERKKSIGDLLSFEVMNRSSQARKTSNSTIFNLKNKKGKFTNHLSYNFSASNMIVLFDDITENQVQPFPMTNISNSEHDHGLNSHTLILGSKWDIDSLKNLTIHYNFFSQNHKHFVNDNQRFIMQDQNILNNAVNRDMIKRDNRHVLTSYYKHTLPGLGILNLTIDYSNNNRDEPASIVEFNRTNETNRNLDLLNNSNNHIVSLNSGFDFNPVNSIKNRVGFRYVEMNNHGDTRLLNVSDNVVLNTESNRINESVGALYYMFSADFQKLTTEIGLRGEITRSIIKLNESIVVDSMYHELFPSAMVGYQFSDDFSINFDYSRKIYRPSFSEINPNYIYADSLTYRIGNPTLRPTISDLFSVSFSLPWSLYLVADYEAMKDYIALAFFNDEEVQGRIRITNVNIPKSEVFGLNLFSSYRGKKLTVSSAIGINFPILDIPYLDSTIQIRQPIGYFRSSLNYQVLENVSLFGDFFYQSQGSQQLLEYRPFYVVNTGISANFLKNRFSVSLEINDLLNTYQLEWESKYGQIRYSQLANYDTQSLRLTLKYNFGDFRDIFQDKSAINEEINRI